jgi:hypothetical protein
LDSWPLRSPDQSRPRGAGSLDDASSDEEVKARSIWYEVEGEMLKKYAGVMIVLALSIAPAQVHMFFSFDYSSFGKAAD